MENKIMKPKLTAKQLINKMKYEKGITFKYTSEEEAERYLSNINNYLRTAAYRKNYSKYQKGPNTGKYINLDFAYLQELSTLDMHFRFIVSKMCLDIEHDLKVRILKDIENDNTTDGYDIVQKFLYQNPYTVRNIERNSYSPFTQALIFKYFTIQQTYNPNTRKMMNTIASYQNCPIWILLELLTFGDFIRFYSFYYSHQALAPIPISILNLVKSLRNGVAHNNCIFANLGHGSTTIPKEITQFVSQISTISSSQRKKRLSCRPMLEFICLLYSYNTIVSEKVRLHRISELKSLFFKRMLQKKNFFKDNDLIKSNYDFACKVITTLFT